MVAGVVAGRGFTQMLTDKRAKLTTKAPQINRLRI
jgi:hypothetical protein